jgi:hypothetical protein
MWSCGKKWGQQNLHQPVTAGSVKLLSQKKACQLYTECIHAPLNQQLSGRQSRPCGDLQTVAPLQKKGIEAREQNSADQSRYPVPEADYQNTT